MSEYLVTKRVHASGYTFEAGMRLQISTGLIAGIRVEVVPIGASVCLDRPQWDRFCREGWVVPIPAEPATEAPERPQKPRPRADAEGVLKALLKRPKLLVEVKALLTEQVWVVGPWETFPDYIAVRHRSDLGGQPDITGQTLVARVWEESTGVRWAVKGQACHTCGEVEKAKQAADDCLRSLHDTIVIFEEDLDS